MSDEEHPRSLDKPPTLLDTTAYGADDVGPNQKQHQQHEEVVAETVELDGSLVVRRVDTKPHLDVRAVSAAAAGDAASSTTAGGLLAAAPAPADPADDDDSVEAEIEAFKRRHLSFRPPADAGGTTNNPRSPATAASSSSASPNKAKAAFSSTSASTSAAADALSTASPAVRRLAEETQRRADAAEANWGSDSDEDDFYDDDFGEGEGGADSQSSMMTLAFAERVFRDITGRCDEGAGPGKPSPVRTAAACLLLEQLCAQYPQYVTILTAISDVIMRSVFVPDTADMRNLLGGSVRRKRFLTRIAGAAGSSCALLSAASSSHQQQQKEVPLPDDLRALYGRLLRPYARKTYAEAHAELSEGLVAHAKANRNIELRLAKQTSIFERTVKHWSGSVLRNHFVVWRQHTRKRKQIREKYRTIFGRMRTDESRVKAIRAWRDRAAKMKRLAMFDTASLAELEGISASTEKMQEQIAALQAHNSALSAQILELERDRQVLQSDIGAKERVVVELSLRARDMGRVGTQLLDGAIVRRPPPGLSVASMIGRGVSGGVTASPPSPSAGGGGGGSPFDGVSGGGVGSSPPLSSGSTADPIEVLVEWASQMFEAAGGAIDGQRNVLHPLRSDATDDGSAAAADQLTASPSMGGGLSHSQNQNQQQQHGGAEAATASAAAVNIPLPALGIVMLGFTDERAPSREQIIHLHTLKDSISVAKELVNMCARLTAAPSLVTAEQLASRQRPMLLLFLAALFRHYTNYILNKPLPSVGGEVPAVSPFARAGAELMGGLSSNSAGGGGSPASSLRPTFAEDVLTAVHNSTAAAASNGAGNGAGSELGGRRATVVGGILPEEEDPEAQAAEAVGQWADRVAYQQQWIAASMASLHAALDLALQRPTQLSSEEQEDLGKFFNVTMGKLSDILPAGISDTFFVTFFRSLTQVFPDLRKVYSAYAVPTLSYHDLVRLLKDCKLLGPRRFQRSQVVLLMLGILGIDPETFGSLRGSNAAKGGSSPSASSPSSFAQHTASSAAAAGANAGGAAPPLTIEGGPKPTIMDFITPEDCSTLELGPAGFTECIIRLALAHCRKAARDNSLLLSSSAIVTNFFVEHIVPHALRSDVDRFKHAFRHPLTQAVVGRHKINLRRAFHAYAREDGGEGMGLAAFRQMARDCRWDTNRHLRSSAASYSAASAASAAANGGEDALADVFRRCQADNGGSYETLDLYEWLEAICALAVYDDPNPLTPLHAKLEPFIEDKVLPIVSTGVGPVR